MIKKIKSGDGLTAHELLELEIQLIALRPELSIEKIQKFRNVDFLVFLRDIIGLSHEYDPKEMIERKFDEYITQSQEFNSKQLEFLLVLKKVFAERKRIEIADLGKSPLSDEHPLDSFQFEALQKIVKMCNEIKMK